MERPAMLNERKTESRGETVALAAVLLAVCLFLFLNAWFYSRFFVMKVNGGSMDDTFYGGVEVAPQVYEGGDIVYADSRAEAKRGDVVIVDVRRYPTYAGLERIIKRLIAIEGDELYCEQHVLYLKKAGEADFAPLEEDYVNYPTPDFGLVHVGEGEIYVAGDHRTDSKDSRDPDVGCLKEEDILAVVPDWAIAAKDATTKWEGFREAISDGLAGIRNWFASGFSS